METKTRCNDTELSLEERIKSKMLLQLISAEVEYHFNIRNREHIITSGETTLEERKRDFVEFVKKNTDASVHELASWYGLGRFGLDEDELGYMIFGKNIK